MINFSKYKAILWDFDGVVMDSMPVRERGFEIVLSGYPEKQVSQLLTYHRENGGLSRYVKFRYFFEQILMEVISEENLLKLTSAFSEVMRRELVNRELLIEESVSFIRQHHKDLSMHVVSGSDEKELRFLCHALQLSDYFVSIHGSPTPKKELVGEVIHKHNYRASDLVLIGDSKNDLDAANMHDIDFYGYNNIGLDSLGAGYIKTFNAINFGSKNDISH